MVYSHETLITYKKKISQKMSVQVFDHKMNIMFLRNSKVESFLIFQI